MGLLRYLLLLLLVLVTISSSVFATTLRGSLYDENLSEVDDVFVVVYKDLEPVQRQVAQDGTYEFILTSGTHLVTARTLREEPMLGAKVEITIDTEGAFVSDLILEEMTEEEFEEIIQRRKNETAQNSAVEDSSFINYLNTTWVASALFLVVIVFTMFFLVRKYRNKVEKKKYSPKEENSEFSEASKEADLAGNDDLDFNDQDDESNKVLDLIKREKRITQKDIRNKFDLSEAKISLIITDLQNKGYVRRVKKGRGNVIVYNFKE